MYPLLRYPLNPLNLWPFFFYRWVCIRSLARGHAARHTRVQLPLRGGACPVPHRHRAVYGHEAIRTGRVNTHRLAIRELTHVHRIFEPTFNFSMFFFLHNGTSDASPHSRVHSCLPQVILEGLLLVKCRLKSRGMILGIIEFVIGEQVECTLYVR
jgi:hypothetical protein